MIIPASGIAGGDGIEVHGGVCGPHGTKPNVCIAVASEFVLGCWLLLVAVSPWQLSPSTGSGQLSGVSSPFEQTNQHNNYQQLLITI